MTALAPIPARGLTCAHCDEEVRVVHVGGVPLLECSTHGLVDAAPSGLPPKVRRRCQSCGDPMVPTGRPGRPRKDCPSCEALAAEVVG